MLRVLIILSVFFLTLFSKNLEEVSLKLNWKYQFQFAGFIAAKEKGFYEEAGLDVKLIEKQGQEDFIAGLIDNKYDYVLSGSRMFTHKNLKDLKLIANYLKQSPLGVVAKKDILTFNALRGKNVILTDYAIKMGALSLLFDKYNMTINDVNLVPLTYDINAFLKPDVDAMTVYTTDQLYYLDKMNVNYNLFIPSNYGFNTPEINLLSTKNTYNINKDRTLKFIEATNKGWEYALKHKEELISIIYNKYSKRKNIDSLRYEAQRIHEMFLDNLFAIGQIDLKYYQPYFNHLHEKRDIEIDFSNLIHQSDKLQLSAKEELWRKYQKKLELIVQDDAEPFVFLNKNNQYEGLAVDYAKNIAKILNLKLTFTKKQVANPLKINYINLQSVVLSNKNSKDIKNKNINITDNLYLQDSYKDSILRDDYKNILDELKKSKNTFFITNELASKYWQKKQPTQLIQANKKNSQTIPYRIYFANYNSLEAHNAIKKSIEFMDMGVKRDLYAKWSLNHVNSVDYTLIYKLLLVVIVVITIILIYNYNLKQNVKERTLEINDMLRTFDENILGIKIDKKHQIIYISEALLKKTKFTKEELLYKSFYKVFNDNLTALLNAIDSKKEYSGELKCVKNKKSYYWGEVKAVKIYDIDHKLIGFNIFINDITTKKEIEHANIKIANLNNEVEETQKEILFRLGAVAEARSKETGLHVKRVAKYSELLAINYGFSKEEAKTIKLASPMHDIGKVGIPDSILNKKGKLTVEEFEIMKTHAKIGHEMLKGSDKPIIKAASIITLNHHEKFDGTGYPRALKGEEIHIYGRIIAVADVFDALGSKRVYKDSWSNKQILEYFQEQSGKHFDPILVDILQNNMGEFIKIQEELKDK